jgi:hypothetical protein
MMKSSEKGESGVGLEVIAKYKNESRYEEIHNASQVAFDFIVLYPFQWSTEFEGVLCL